jgi:hypothetical protein
MLGCGAAPEDARPRGPHPHRLVHVHRGSVPLRLRAEVAAYRGVDDKVTVSPPGILCMDNHD